MDRRAVLRRAGLATTGALAGCLDALPSPADPTPTGEGAGANPWGEDVLVVAVEQVVPARRGFVDLVEAALDYWEENARTSPGTRSRSGSDRTPPTPTWRSSSSRR